MMACYARHRAVGEGNATVIGLLCLETGNLAEAEKQGNSDTSRGSIRPQGAGNSPLFFFIRRMNTTASMLW